MNNYQCKLRETQLFNCNLTIYISFPPFSPPPPNQSRNEHGRQHLTMNMAMITLMGSKITFQISVFLSSLAGLVRIQEKSLRGIDTQDKVKACFIQGCLYLSLSHTLSHLFWVPEPPPNPNMVLKRYNTNPAQMFVLLCCLWNNETCSNSTLLASPCCNPCIFDLQMQRADCKLIRNRTPDSQSDPYFQTLDSLC